MHVSLFQFPIVLPSSLFFFRCLEAWYKLNNNTHSRLVYKWERSILSHCFLVKLFWFSISIFEYEYTFRSDESLSCYLLIYSFVVQLFPSWFTNINAYTKKWNTCYKSKFCHQWEGLIKSFTQVTKPNSPKATKPRMFQSISD